MPLRATTTDGLRLRLNPSYMALTARYSQVGLSAAKPNKQRAFPASLYLLQNWGVNSTSTESSSSRPSNIAKLQIQIWKSFMPP